MAKLLRFSLGVYIGVLFLTFSSARLSLGEAIRFSFAPVGLLWPLWALGIIAPDAAEIVRYGTERLIVSFAREPELPPAPPEHIRQIPVHNHSGEYLMDYDPAPDYRRLVIGFVIRGGQVGGYTYRTLAGRALDGKRVDFALWRRITDESYVFLKSNQGTFLRYPLAKMVQRLSDGLPLANEKVRYAPDEVSVLA